MMSKLDEFMLLSSLSQNYMPPPPPLEIFHYTSPQGFSSILFEDSDFITLWASRADCLNDASEGHIAYKMFQDTCCDMLRQNEITENMFSLIQYVSPARTRLIQHYCGDKIISTRPECDMFISSFSEDRDSLAMWNYYAKGNRYEGYNFGLSPKEIETSLSQAFREKEVEFGIYPVIYSKTEQRHLIRELLLKLQEHYSKDQESSIKYFISNRLSDWSLVFKDEHFQHEKEVRVIVYVARKTKDGILQQRPIEIKYRDVSGYTVPYIELRIDKNALTSVMVGPLMRSVGERQTQISILNERLKECNYTAIADCSEIPVRY